MEYLQSFFPIEIASHIIQYTYRLQNKQLLSDIINFTESKTKLLELYLLYYSKINDYEITQYVNWLANDIVFYMNTFRHTGVLYGGGYVDKFYSRFSRNPFLNSREKIDNYVIHLTRTSRNGNIMKEINIYLGLLTIQERSEFIQWYQSANSHLV